MEKNQFGVWSLRLLDSGGNPAIPHNSRVKFRFQHGDGVWVDRIPAWIKYATVYPTRFGAPYDGVYWDPPPSESFNNRHAARNNVAAMLPFVAQVAAANYRALGARTGLPLRSDPCLASFLHQSSKVRVTT